MDHPFFYFTSPAAPRSLARAIHRPTPGSVHRSASQGQLLEKPEPEEREEKPVLVRAVILGIWHLRPQQDAYNKCMLRRYD